MTAKTRQPTLWVPALGESGWEVEWCVRIPIDPETGDGDMDNAEYKSRDFRTREEAMAYAKEVFPQDAFGAVSVAPFTIEPLSETWPYGRSREYTADSEYYEGED